MWYSRILNWHCKDSRTCKQKAEPSATALCRQRWKWKGSKLQEYIITSRTNWWLIPQRMTSIRASLDHGFAPHIYPICLVWVSQSLPREQTAPRQPRGFHNYLGAWRHQSGISRHHLPNHRGYGELKNQGSIPVHQSLLADVFRKAGVSPTAREHWSTVQIP